MANKFLMWICFTIFCMLLIGGAAQADEKDIIFLIEKTAAQEGIDPNLAVAIAKRESQLDDTKVGGLGEIGVFQLRPEYHKVKKGHIKENIRVAIRYMVVVKKTCEPKYGDAWFICYNTGPNYEKSHKPIRYPKLFPYYKGVMLYVQRNYIAFDN